MEENRRIAGLFSNSYDGNPWLDVTILGTLETIPHDVAARKLNPDTNSIWEIVNHLISWRENVLKRVNGKTIDTPAHNYFTPVTDTTETAWYQTLGRLAISQQKWLDFLQDFDDFETIYRRNGHTHYEHIHGILHHDNYHIGQVVLLKKLLYLKPFDL